MKILPLLLLSLATWPRPGHAQPVANVLRDSATMPLRSPPFFAMGGVGYGGEISMGERALRTMARDPNAIELFEAILDDRRSSSAGRLYALLGLKWTNESRFNARLAPFLRDETSVEECGGCFVFHFPVYFLARHIQDGKYARPAALNAATRPPVRIATRPHRAQLWPEDVLKPFKLTRAD